MEAARENWGSRLGFVLAVAGSAIGLGNIWKFPYVTGVNGGGAFVLLYLVCILFCGVPLMICELSIGRKAKANPAKALEILSGGRNKMCKYIAVLVAIGAVIQAYASSPGLGMVLLLLAIWLYRKGIAAVGALSIITALLILSYYSVIGGWIIEYAVKAFSGNMDFTTVDQAGKAFGDFIGNSSRVILWNYLFMALAALMLLGGIKGGIERWSKILMPVLFVLLMVIVVRSLTLPGAEKGVDFLLKPDFSKLSAAGALEALGHSFYTLSLGMAIGITYGSYLSNKENLFSATLNVVIVDTLAAVLAGLAIFPAVFAMGFAPSAGPSLIFNVLPVTFNTLPGGLGWLWGGLFFAMLTIAALTSAASLLECGVTYMVDTWKMNRKLAIAILYILLTSLGYLSCVSIADWSNLELLHTGLVSCFGSHLIPGNWFDLLDKLTSNWIIPLIGLAEVLFVGWFWGIRNAAQEIRIGSEACCDKSVFVWLAGLSNDPAYQNSVSGSSPMNLWAIMTRYCAPVVIFALFLKAIGVNIGF
jgi:NSS family neurotransmitter:Na+ symporter